MDGDHKRRFTNYILVVKHEDTIECLSNNHLYFIELTLEKYYNQLYIVYETNETKSQKVFFPLGDLSFYLLFPLLA